MTLSRQGEGYREQGWRWRLGGHIAPRVGRAHRGAGEVQLAQQVAHRALSQLDAEAGKDLGCTVAPAPTHQAALPHRVRPAPHPFGHLRRLRRVQPYRSIQSVNHVPPSS